jgi:chemotaxis protein histidine kinase CheA
MNQKSNSLLNDDDDEFLKALRDDFFVETNDSFEKCESLLLNYEETQNELKLIEYKRILHSIKGSAKAVSEDEFANVIHLLEDTLISKSKDGLIDFQLKILDSVSSYINAMKENDETSASAALAVAVNLLKK